MKSNAMYAGSAVGSGSGTIGAGAQLATPTEPRFDSLSNDMVNTMVVLGSCESRLRAVADRLIGGIPQSLEKNQAETSDHCVLSRLHNLSEKLIETARRIESSIDRLETL